MLANYVLKGSSDAIQINQNIVASTMRRRHEYLDKSRAKAYLEKFNKPIVEHQRGVHG